MQGSRYLSAFACSSLPSTWASATIPGWPPGTPVRTEHLWRCSASRRARAARVLLWGPGLKGSSGEAAGTKDSREMPSASCQSSVTLQRGTSAKGQQRVEERALGLLSEAKLGAMWPFSRAGVTLKVTFSNPYGLCTSHHTTTPSPT